MKKQKLVVVMPAFNAEKTLRMTYAELPHDMVDLVILVDDGLATGSTMRAAVAALRQQEPARILVAVPTAPQGTCDEFRAEADACICADIPEWLYAVGQSYEEFPQISDAEVQDLLSQATRKEPARIG